MANKSTNTFMFALANEGIDPVDVVGPALSFWQQSALVHKTMVGSINGG
jgi:hypothetical protein